MTHPVDIHVGHKLKQLRKLHKLSQTDLAQKLELSFQQIQKYESGSNRISASRLFELGEFLNVSPAYFFVGIHDTENAAEKQAQDIALTTALSSIHDEKTKKQILNFIEDISAEKATTKG